MDQKQNDQSIKTFLKSLQKKQNGQNFHNVGIIQSVDMNGNVKSMKYFCNLFTSWGFQNFCNNVFAYYSSGSYNYTGNIYIGSNDNHQTHTYGMTQLFNKINMEPIRVTVEHAVTGIYYYENNVASQLIRSYQCYFDYNYDGFEEPVTIRELGLGSSRYNGDMITLSDVYDINGETSEIVKNPNERLYIQYYLNSIIEKSVIDRLWNKGIYYLSQPAAVCFPPAGCVYRGWSSEEINYYAQRMYLIQHNDLYNTGLNCITPSSGSGISYNEQGTVINMTNPSSSILFDHDNFQNATELLVGSSYETRSNYSQDPSLTNRYQLGYFRIFYKQLRRPTPEQIETQYFWTNRWDSKYFEDVFNLNYDGLSAHGLLPITQFNCTALKYFDYEDGDYTNDQAFVNKPNQDFSKLWEKICTWMNVNGAIYYVFAHPECATVSITGLRNEGQTWVTDNYLDPSSYQSISDNANFPSQLQNTKYIIRSSSDFLDPIIKDENRMQLVLTNQPTTYQYQISSISRTIKASSTYGWIMSTVDFIFPDHIQDSGVFLNKVFDKLGELWIAKYSIPESDYVNGAWCAFHQQVQKFYDGRYIVLLIIDTNNTTGMHFFGNDNSDRSYGSPNCLVRLDMSQQTIDDIADSATICWWDEYTSTHQSLTNNHTCVCGDYDESSHYYMITDITNGMNVLICDIDTMSSFYIENAYYPHFIYGTTYVGYWTSSTSEHLVIYDMETKQIVKEFDMPDLDTRVYGDFIAFKNFIYIQTTANGVDGAILTLLNIEDETFSTFVPPTNFNTPYTVFNKQKSIINVGENVQNLSLFASNFPANLSESNIRDYVIENYFLTNVRQQMWKYSGSNIYHSPHAFIHYIKDTHNNNDFIVYYDSITENYTSNGTDTLSKSGASVFILKEDSPENIIQLYNDGNALDKRPSGLVGFSNTVSSHLRQLNVKWVDSSYFLELNGSTSAMIYDIGEIITLEQGRQPQEFYALNHFNIGSINGSAIVASNEIYPFLLYDAGVILQNSENKISWQPIETFRRYVASGTTTTMSTYNNPFYVSNLGCSLSLTNHMDLNAT